MSLIIASQIKYEWIKRIELQQINETMVAKSVVAESCIKNLKKQNLQVYDLSWKKCGYQ